MTLVHNGETVFIDYKTGIEPIVNVKFTTDDDKKLLHISKSERIFYTPTTWIFYKFNPWSKQISKVMMRCIEAGLIEIWKRKTFKRMRDESETFEEKPKDLISVVTLTDVQVVFYLFSILFLASCLAFVVEVLNKRTRDAKEPPVHRIIRVQPAW